MKTLLETGMYKSLKGHQTLCDVLKKQILNRNPRKEGVGFERKMNTDGSYWKPEQYPKTTWVAAKGPPVDPSTLSGFTCANPIIIDESFNANYKLFKNQNGEVFARYIGTYCRNGPPMKKMGAEKVVGESSCECHHDTTREEDKPQTTGFIRSKGFIQTEDSPESH